MKLMCICHFVERFTTLTHKNKTAGLHFSREYACTWLVSFSTQTFTNVFGLISLLEGQQLWKQFKIMLRPYGMSTSNSPLQRQKCRFTYIHFKMLLISCTLLVRQLDHTSGYLLYQTVLLITFQLILATRLQECKLLLMVGNYFLTSRQYS